MDGSSWLGWADLTYIPEEGVTVEYPFYIGDVGSEGAQTETVKALDILHKITGPGGSPLTEEQDGVLTACGEWLDAQAEGLTGDPRTGDDGALTATQGQVVRNLGDYLEGVSDA